MAAPPLRRRISAAPPTPGPAADGPSPLDLLRPRQPFRLAQPGRALLFDVGASGDFVAAFTSSEHERRGDGTFPGRENRVFPREVSLGVFGRVDPYASAVVRISAGQEAPGHEGGDSEFTVVLDEANVTLLALPLGITPRFGLMRPRFGTLNSVHQDDLPQVDRPVVLRRFFGEEQLNGEVGLEAMALLPWWPFYQEVSVGVFNGDNETTAFGRGSLRDPLVMGRLRTFFELGDWGGLQVDMSAATGVTEDERRNTVAGLGLKYKWSPAVGYGFPVITVATEVVFGSRRVADEAGGGDRRLDRWGYYAYGRVDLKPRWAIGPCVTTGQSNRPARARMGAVAVPCSSARPSSCGSGSSTRTPTTSAGGRDADEGVPPGLVHPWAPIPPSGSDGSAHGSSPRPGLPRAAVLVHGLVDVGARRRGGAWAAAPRRPPRGGATLPGPLGVTRAGGRPGRGSSRSPASGRTRTTWRSARVRS